MAWTDLDMYECGACRASYGVRRVTDRPEIDPRCPNKSCPAGADGVQVHVGTAEADVTKN